MAKAKKKVDLPDVDIDEKFSSDNSDEFTSDSSVTNSNKKSAGVSANKSANDPKESFTEDEVVGLDEILDVDEFEVTEEQMQEGLNISLPENLGEDERLTRVRVVKEGNVVEEVDPSEASEYLRKAKKDIQKIIVEQVRMKGADRVSFVVGDEDPEAIQDKLSITDDVKTIDIIDEKEVGTDFLDVESELNKEFLKSESNVSDLNEKIRNFKKSFENKNIEPGGQVEHKNLYPQAEKQAEVVDEENEVIGESDGDFIYRQQVWHRKQRHEKNNYYYQVENHLELYNIGRSYQEDYEKGIKSFGFHSIELREDREKTVFGISSYFNYHTESTIMIFTESLRDSFYYYYIRDLKSDVKYIPDEDFSFEVHKGKGFEIYEFKEMKRVFKKLSKYSIEDFLEKLCESADIILWDLPSIEEMSDCREVFFPVVRRVENVSLIVKENNTRMKDVETMKDYFKKYGVKIKGLLINSMLKGKKAS